MIWAADTLDRAPKPRPDYLPGDLVLRGRMRIKHVRWVYDYWVYVAVPA